MRQGITSKNSVPTLFLTRQIFMRQDILLAHFLCDRVQGVEKFSTHPLHFPSQVPPGGATREPTDHYRVNNSEDIKYHLSRDSSYKRYNDIKKHSKLNCRLCEMNRFFEMIADDINYTFQLCKF